MQQAEDVVTHNDKAPVRLRDPNALERVHVDKYYYYYSIATGRLLLLFVTIYCPQRNKHDENKAEGTGRI